MTYTCTICGEEKTEATEATGHAYGEWQKDDAIYHKKECSCKDTVREIHAWDEGTVTKEPTYTESGEKTYTCTVCGEEKTEDIPVSEHTHNWNAGEETKAPTCTETGEMTYTCTECGETKTEVIIATGHSYGEWVAEDATNHKNECSCGDVITEAHTWDEGTVTKMPTTTETGIRTYKCTVCKFERTEEIPVLGENRNGDANGDSFIDVGDVVLVRKFVAGGYNVTVDLSAADVNDDGIVDVKDIIYLRRHIAGGYGVEL